MTPDDKYLYLPVVDFFLPISYFLAFLTSLMVQFFKEPAGVASFIVSFDAAIMAVLVVVSIFGGITERNSLGVCSTWWGISMIVALWMSLTDWTDVFIFIYVLLLEVYMFVPDIRERDIGFFEQRNCCVEFEFSILKCGIPIPWEKVKLQWVRRSGQPPVFVRDANLGENASVARKTKKGIIVSFGAFESEDFVLVGMKRDRIDYLLGTAYVYMVNESSPEREAINFRVPVVIAKLLCTYLPALPTVSKKE